MRIADVSKFVVKDPKSGIYRYYRRVPVEVSHLDPRVHIKQSLKTTILARALERAEEIHTAVETYWRALLSGDAGGSAVEQFAAAVKAAQSLGFAYRTSSEIAAMDIEEIDRRVAVAQRNSHASMVAVNAVLGTAPAPAARISDIWTLYEDYNRAGFHGMSPNQMRKHKIARERAIRYACDVMGNMELSSILRRDVLKLREWWTAKIEDEGLKAYSANRCFSDISGMLSVIDEALQTHYGKPWGKMRLKETNATKLDRRLPFSVEWVQTRLLAPGSLDGTNEDARLIVYAMIETGMRLGEVCNLRREDIRLDDEVPHIEVADRDDRRQKTDHSIRRIPLVGVSLWAMKKRPNGFPRYQDKADSASAVINKALDAAGLRPTRHHTVYSLRHTFQDRIENAGASDRMQADLMGHEFGRPTYGDGPELKRRHQLLERIKFVW